jgi:CheY-like chemotaxis protein
MRQARLDDAAMTKMLDELDRRVKSSGRRRKQAPRFSYRERQLTIEVRSTPDQSETIACVGRNIGRDGMSFVVPFVLHAGSWITINLTTIRSSAQPARAEVIQCRYIQGTVCWHDVEVRFDQPIDPALFTASAICTRVLLADDSSMSQRLLGHLLEPMNVDVVCVETGVEAVNEALASPFDLILMDIEMPQLDGISATKLLRKKGYVRSIAAVSCRTSAEDREACLLAGCDEFIPKPPRREQVAAVVERTRPQPLVSSMLHEYGMAPLIDEFVSELGNRGPQIEQAYHERDVKRLAHLARELKGDAGGFGFESITEAGRDLEDSIQAGTRLTELRPMISRLVRLCLAARPATCDGADSPSAYVEEVSLTPGDEPSVDEFVDLADESVASAGEVGLD